MTDPSSRIAGLSEAKRALLEELRKGKRAALPTTIPARSREGPAPLSFAQQRLWFIHRIEPGSPAYNVPAALRLRGRLDADTLQRCLGEIVRRHETLRTRFLDTDDGPVQVIDAPAPVPLPIRDLSKLPADERMPAAERVAEEEASTPFDLERGPMLRARLLRLADGDHVFLASMHHIVSDGWSMGVFIRELAELYGALSRRESSPLPDLPIQYRDFAAWQRETLRGDRLEAELDHWRSRLSPLAPSPELPADHPRPPVQTFRGGVERVSVPRAVADPLRRLARAEGASLFMALVAAFDALLVRLTGETDLVVGTGVANRIRPELEPLIGFFVNALVLRVDASGDPSFPELLRRTREVTLDAFAHQDLPFERLVEELQPTRDLSRNPLFQVALALQNAPLDDIVLPELTVTPVPSPNHATRFDLEFHLWENEAGGLDGFLFHSLDLFDPETARGIAERYAVLLGSIAEEPTRRISELAVATSRDDAVRRVGSVGRTLAIAERPVVRQFEARAAAHPDAPALDDGTHRLTYADLDARAERLAARLRHAGVGPEDRVGILAGRSIEQVGGVVAVAKTGAAWVPLDPANPDDRLARMATTARLAAVLVGAAGVDRAGPEAPRFRLDEDPDTAAAAAPSPVLPAAGLAYVLFTSGSTGKPNGVEVSQANLAALVAWHVDTFGLTADDRTSLLAGVGFDASVWELWPTLVAGGTLLLPDDDTRLDAVRLRDWIATRGITVAFLPTPLAEQLLPLEWPEGIALRTLLTGGDRLHALPDEALPFRVVNNYGPTETTVVATSGDVDRGASLPLPTLGRPIANVTAHVLDPRFRPVPPGVAGELWIGGAGVARGYSSRPDLTATRFRPDPFAPAPGARLYRTGDRVRALPDGRLEFLGRLDAQVKIRGQRVEPGEAEAALAECPGVRSAVVVARTDTTGASLVAYVVPQRTDPEEEPLRDEHVQRWRDLYDSTYEQSGEDVDPTFDTVGWNSSYTGQPIPAEEMREWRDETVARLRSLRPRRVLEIGCGTGLLLSLLAPGTERYVATDLSRVALDRVRRRMASRVDLSRVELHERPADDLSGLEPGAFDLVILNSVVQYFPDLEYVQRVLDRAMLLVADEGHLFVGDVRDLRLHEAFATSVESSDADASPDDLPRRVQRRLAREEELLLHPGLFAAVADRHERAARAVALVKRGRAVNELTRFRYDVILRIGEGDRDDVAATEIPWSDDPSTLEAAASALRAGSTDELVLRGIPNRRLSDALPAASRGAGPAGLLPGELDDWAAARDRDAVPGLSPAHPERFDLAIVRDGTLPVALRIPLPDPGVPLSNEPLRVTRAGSLIPRLRERLAARLPEALVPGAFVLLDELPLTPNGKVDRRALPEPEEFRRPAGVRVAPRTPTERTIARVWADVLGIREVAATDHFFELGGHSLLATQVLSRLRTALGVDVPLRAIFEAPTVEALAATVDAAAGLGNLRSAGITPAPRDRPIPLSLAQQRLWFIDRLEPGAAAYHIPNVLRLAGPLDVDALARALAAIVARHEALRTRFPEDEDGPRQQVDPPPPPALTVEAVPGATPEERKAEARRLVAAEALAPFDLARGPVLRARLLRLAEDDHVLTLVVHHIAADGWSMGLLVRELGEHYAGQRRGTTPSLPPLPIQYPDWSAWQRAWLADGELDRQLAFWGGELDRVPALELPADRPRPPRPSYRGEAVDVSLDAALVKRLTAFGRERGATLHMTMLAGFAALLGRWSGQEDFAVGTPVAGRRHEQVESLIGFFVNTLAVRVRPGEGRPSFRELLDRVRETTLSAYANQDVPFERIVEEIRPERDASRNPIFQVLFALHNVPLGELRLGDLSIHSFPLEAETAQFDLEMSLFENDGRVTGRLHGSRDLFDRPTLLRFVEHFGRLLQAALDEPDAELADLAFLPDVERNSLSLAGEALRSKPGPTDLAERFERQVDATPESVALGGERDLTYAKLDRHANRIANALIDRGIRRGDRVGVSLPRGAELIAAVLAVRKAGAACVPLDPSYPAERTAATATDAGTRVVVADPVSARRLPAGLEILNPDDPETLPAGATRPRLATSGDDIAYVVFTSGSTGRPKGIAFRQDSLAALMDWQRERSAAVGPQRTLQFASLSFDVSFQEIWCTLTEGGTLVLVAEEVRRDPEALLRTLAGERIERLFLPFVALEAMAEAFADRPFPLALREVITAGERLRVTPAIRALFSALPEATLDNQYGPSETHVVTAHRLDGLATGWPELPPIGRPVSGTRILVADDRGRPVPLGAVGEILVGGRSPACGYERRADLTAERFVPDPCGHGERLYRTGDLGRVLADGTLEFRGRRDRQVKVRGFRVEPAEVEAALARIPGVRGVAVDSRRIGGAAVLTAWVVADSDRTAELRGELAAELPEHLVPTVWVAVDSLPLTPSGKVDVSRLPDPAPPVRDEADLAGLSPEEQCVAEAFRHVLGTGPLGRSAHFFDLGGHSLLATRLVARLRRVAGVEVPLRALFERPTVAELALALDPLPSADTAGSIPVAALADRAPLSFQQERLWFLHRLDPDGTGFTLSAGLELRGDLDVDALTKAFATLVRRHESLRTRFEEDDGEPRQVIDPPGPPPLEFVDASSDPDPGATLAATLEREAGRTFDLACDRLWSATLVRRAERRHALLLTMHHIITDGWSMGILARELGEAYDAFRRGTLPAPSPLAIRYADYAVWQRRWLGDGELDRQLAHWRDDLVGVPPLELPTDRPRPAVLGHRGLRVRREIDAEQTTNLLATVRGEGATLHMALLTAYAVVLSRWAGADDFAVGVPVANRTREETEPLLGYFVNTLALRMDLASRDGSTPTLRDLLHRTRDRSLAAYAHQDVPFESVLEILRPPRDLSRSPVFQVWFNLVNVPGEDARFGDLEVSPLGTEANESRFDLSLYAFEADGTVRLDLIGAADLFGRPRLRELLDQVVLVLAALGDDPDRPARDVSLVTPDATAVLPDGNRPLADDWLGPVPELFARRAAERPEAVAIASAAGTWSYAQLDERKNRLAHALVARGVRPGDAVAILAHRSAPTALAVLGTLEAGAATVLLDPAHPAARLEACLRAANVRALIHVQAAGEIPSSTAGVLAELGAPILRLPDGPALDERLADFPATPTGVSVGARDPACITFTSGSTGTPKPVRGAHGPLTHFQPELERRFGLTPEDRFTLLSGLSHDPLQRDLFTPLLLGAAVVIPEPDDLDPGRLAAWVERHRVTAMCLTPAMSRILTADPRARTLPDVRIVLSLGESLARRDVRELQARLPRATIVNLYGTTETQRSVGHFVVPPGDPIRGEDGRPLELETIPAGVGLGSAQLLVRGPVDAPAGVGELGEIWIRGPHLALGYADEELTRQRFVGEGGDRRYRTGDLGRYLPDGHVQVAGRRDDQVNVRGFRVELGEVQAALAAHPDVGDAVAGLDAEGRLVGWVTRRGDRSPEPRAVREEVRRRVPEALVPWTVVVIESIPLTPNGKVDRRALPAPAAPETPGVSSAPRSAEEQTAVELFAAVLDQDAVGPHDDFFERGGHSLLAVRLLSRAGNAFNTEIALRAFFEEPTPVGLARAAVRARRGGAAPVGRVVPAPAAERTKLSYAQRRLWFIDRLEPNSAAYHLPSALSLSGRLDPDALATALADLETRHESLRTRFVPGPDGPEQRFDPPGAGILERIDLTGAGEPEAELHRRLAADARTPFDLESGPCWRRRLYRIAPEEHVLSLVFHHIVTDGGSTEVLVRELAVLYAAHRDGRGNPLPPPVVQYADWAAWQRSWLDGGELERQRAHWEEELDGVAPLELPTDRPRPARRGQRGASRPVRLPETDAAALARFVREENATLFHALFGAFQAMLGRFAGSADVVAGTPVANRTVPEAEGLVGFFANTLALRTRLRPGMTFRGLVRAVRRTTLEAQAHQDVPFETVVDALDPVRDLSRNPLFDTMFVLRHAGAAAPTGDDDLTVETMALETGAAAFDLTMVLGEAAGQVSGALEYDIDLFDAETIDRFTAHFVALVREGLRRPDVPIGEFDLRPAAERALVVSVNATGRHTEERTLASFVEENARRHPDAVAVRDEERSLTYRELDRLAGAVAARLVEAGARPERAVGLACGRGVRAVLGMVAIWKAGGVYVPLDPSQPRERQESMLRDADVRLVLAEAGRETAVPDRTLPVIPLEHPDDATAERGRPARLRPSNAAYVIFTSGSTGEPKGSVVEHGAAATRALATARLQQLAPGVRTLHFFSLPFDGSLLEILPALAAGATIVVHPDPRGETPADFLRRCERDGLNVVHTPVGFFHEVADELARTGVAPPPGLRLFAAGGEAPRVAQVDAFLRGAGPGLTYQNLYGPTETIIICTAENVTRADVDAGRVPLGHPLPNTGIHLLDDRLRPVPIGALGEIYLAGPLLARAYAARPDRTAAAFLPDPYTEIPGARMYRTGDLARRLGDGRLVFVGRRDAQVKIRGFRVELDEIEIALTSVPGVRESAVSMQGSGATARIVAHYVPSGEDPVQEADVHAALRDRLPDYMVPSALVPMTAFPRTRTGKIDRRALPDPERAARGGRRTAPRDEHERALAPLWAEVLRLDDVDVEESFFEAGGNSLLAIRFVAAVRRETGRDVPVATLFREPTLAGLARRLHAEAGDGPSREPIADNPFVAMRRGGDEVPLFCFPAIGGGLGDFAELVEALAAGRPVWAAPAFGQSDDAHRIEAAASRRADAILDLVPHGPIHLLGWSYGALVAFETARRLAAAGREIGALVLVDAPAPTGAPIPDAPAIPGAEDVLPPDVSPADAADWRAGVDARRAAIDRYRPAAFDGDVTVVRGTESIAGRSRGADLGWSALVRGDLRVEWAPGSHDSILTGEGARAVASLIERIIPTPPHREHS